MPMDGDRAGCIFKIAIVFSWACIATALLAGCGESTLQASVDNFVLRMRAPQHPDVGTALLQFAPKLPEIGKLRIPLQPANVEALDFLALKGCALKTTLGKYNSSLGRFASDSQRLLLDLEYLRLAPRCVDYKASEGETELAAILEQSRKLKQAQLPSLIFNATLANREFHQFWGNTAAMLTDTEQHPVSLESIQAVNQLAQRWLSGDYRADNLELEIHLSEIAKGIGNATGGHHHKLFLTVVQLERQLHSVLPTEYQHWQGFRDNYLARLAQATKLH